MDDIEPILYPLYITPQELLDYLKTCLVQHDWFTGLEDQEVESFHLPINQKENDIEKLNGKIMNLDDDISALTDQLKKTHDEKKRIELKQKRNS